MRNVILRRIYKRGFLLFDPFHARLASNTRKILPLGAKFLKVNIQERHNKAVFYADFKSVETQQKRVIGQTICT